MAFNTKRKNQPPYIKPHHEAIIINDDLEYAFPKEDLYYIKDFAHLGIKQLAKDLKRDDFEVLWAYIHLHRQGYKLPQLGVLR